MAVYDCVFLQFEVLQLFVDQISIFYICCKLEQKDEIKASEVFISSLTGLEKGCKKGCTKNLCLNGGICIERWGEGHYECDCSRSNFAGKQCELGMWNFFL